MDHKVRDTRPLKNDLCAATPSRARNLPVYQCEYGTQIVKMADLNTTLFKPGRWTGFDGLHFGKDVS